MTLFNSIAFSNSEGIIPGRELNLITKQYYSRISRLLNAGFIKRHKGKVDYHSQITKGKAYLQSETKVNRIDSSRSKKI
jgi:hypothetical protein